MSARKRKMIRKANELVDFGYKPTFRQMMVSYRFWMMVKRGKYKYATLMRLLRK